jgi:hypothetical protein
MKKIVLITPDRGDRPELLSHCMWQMERQTVSPLKHLVINYPGISGVVDIVPRVKEGIKQALELGAEFVLIIENDDYYPDNYVETMSKLMERDDIIGSDRSIYYSLQSNCMKIFCHPGRSSLYLTGFRPDMMADFKWPDDTMLYFDIHLWNNFKGKRGFAQFTSKPIGMKHGQGFTPGNYHNGVVNGKAMKNMMMDPARQWLKNNTRPESFEFYKQFHP